MAKILKGAPVAAALCESLSGRAEELQKRGIVPTLAIVRVGERPDGLAYVRGAVKRCEQAKVAVRVFALPQDCSKRELLDVVRAVNDHPSIHGCLLLRPLLDKEAEQAACALLAPEKDVDGVTAASLAKVFTGSGEGFAPCTAQACLELLDYYGCELRGRRVTVIGRSLVVGRPVSMLLQRRDATVTMCHTKTTDLAAACRGADVIVAAAGRPNVVGKSHVAPGQTVVDVGINADEQGGLCGDVDFDAVEPVVAAISPVPGGVGTVTTAVLAQHVIEAAEKQAAKTV